MPGEIIEPATPPDALLGGRHRKIFQNVAHEAPALEVRQVCEVAEHACKVHPDQWIDPGDGRTTETKVDPRCTSFKSSRRVIEGGSPNPQDTDALSLQATEVDVIG
jgi:hypothetical protein